jgi:hypothetical protein
MRSSDKSFGPRTPAFEAVKEIVEMNPASLIPSFPCKRESRDFSRLLWAPAFVGATTLAAAAISFTSSQAGVQAFRASTLDARFRGHDEKLESYTLTFATRY